MTVAPQLSARPHQQLSVRCCSCLTNTQPRVNLRCVRIITSLATMGHTKSLQPDKLPSPFYHNKQWDQHGIKGSVNHDLWEVLKLHPTGLLLAQILQQLDSALQETEVTCALEQDAHFTQLSRDRWGLAVYKPLRWGFAGAGKIAADFVEILALVPGAELTAVACGSKERQPQAQAFADKHGVRKAVADYRELADDSEVDIVYVSNLHPDHKDTTILMLKHGKHVLCEKPLAVNAADTKAMVSMAQKTGLFFCAGIWTRFFPATKQLREVINSGIIGDVHHFHCEFITPMPESMQRMYDPKLAGGALLDVGIYPLSITSWIFGGKAPESVSAMGILHPKGVDTFGMVNLRYGSEQMASLTYGINMAAAPREGTVHGTKGNIKLHASMHALNKFTVQVTGQEAWTMEYPGIEKPDSINHGPKNGFNCSGSLGFIYQAMGVHSAVVNGRTQIDHIGAEEMVMLMEVADNIRKQVGLRYPQDDAGTGVNPAP